MWCVALVLTAGLLVQGTSVVPVLAFDRASGESRSLVPLDEELAGAVPLHKLPADRARTGEREQLGQLTPDRRGNAPKHAGI